MKLANKNAVVTGAAKGMGAAITETLAREGADIFLAARDIAALNEVANTVRKMGRRAEVCACDVVDEKSVATMVEKAKEFFGDKIDILANVAGVTGPIETPVQDIKPDDFSYVIEANIRGTYLPIKYIVPVMIARRSGKICKHRRHVWSSRLQKSRSIQFIQMGCTGLDAYCCARGRRIQH